MDRNYYVQTEAEQRKAAEGLLKAYRILLARHERMVAEGHVFEVDEEAEQLAAACEEARQRRLGKI